jgi:uncharacterized NAD(P)/FAD-binding protein YdhS
MPMLTNGPVELTFDRSDLTMGKPSCSYVEWRAPVDTGKPEHYNLFPGSFEKSI